MVEGCWFRRKDRAHDAELVAYAVFHDHPRDVALAYVDTPGTESPSKRRPSSSCDVSTGYTSMCTRFLCTFASEVAHSRILGTGESPAFASRSAARM